MLSYHMVLLGKQWKYRRKFIAAGRQTGGGSLAHGYIIWYLDKYPAGGSRVEESLSGGGDYGEVTLGCMDVATTLSSYSLTDQC